MKFNNTDRPFLIRLRGLIEMTGLSKSTIYRLEAAGQFPARVKLSERLVGWRSEEVSKWLSTRGRA